MAWTDLTLPLKQHMAVYPGDPAVDIETIISHDQDQLQLSRIALGSHSGTHLDAPRHFIRDGRSVEAIELDRLIVKASVVQCVPNAQGEIDLSMLDFTGLEKGEALLLSTGWERQWGQPGYFHDCPIFAPGSSDLIRSLGISLLGVDMPTVIEAGHPQGTAGMHVSLLSEDILLVENLTNLAGVAGKTVSFMALPLPITGCDGSPVRACCRLAED